MDDNFFGIRKVRFFFGRGFFKIKSNKRIVSVLNLGIYGLSVFVLIFLGWGKD